IHSLLENVHTSYLPAPSYRELLAEKIHSHPSKLMKPANSITEVAVPYKFCGTRLELRDVVERSGKCRECGARFTTVQQHVPGDHAHLLVKYSFVESRLCPRFAMRGYIRDCGERAGGVKRVRSRREERQGKKGIGLPRFSADRLLISGLRNCSISYFFSFSWPSDQGSAINRQTGINRAASSSLIKPLDYRAELSGHSRCWWRSS
ncbi:hypothetical protein X777_07327, partial [Ooceraea biroi]